LAEIVGLTNREVNAKLDGPESLKGHCNVLVFGSSLGLGELACSRQSLKSSIHVERPNHRLLGRRFSRSP